MDSGAGAPPPFAFLVGSRRRTGRRSGCRSGCGAPLEQEERRRYTLARHFGKGVRFPQCNAFSVGRCPGRRAGRGGLGTNPEYAVKSTHRFLTALSRIKVEIKDQGKVPLLKIWVRRSPLRPLPPWARLALGDLSRPGPVLWTKGWETRKRVLDKEIAVAAAPAGKGSEQSRNVP
jgi:hypothetical protein